MITKHCDVFKLIDPPLKSALTENREENREEKTEEKIEEITEEKTEKKR